MKPIGTAVCYPSYAMQADFHAIFIDSSISGFDKKRAAVKAMNSAPPGEIKTEEFHGVLVTWVKSAKHLTVLDVQHPIVIH